jgi:hypothetical protein
VTAKEFRAIREGLNLTAIQWGLALGYAGEPTSVARAIYYYESGDREIPERVARLATMFKLHGIPKHWLPT